jgi:hypothetical protein
MGVLLLDRKEPAAKEPVGFQYDWKHVDLALLEDQQAYFVYGLECLNFSKRRHTRQDEGIGTSRSLSNAERKTDTESA